MALRLHRLADSEFRDAIRWYRAESSDIALRFHQSVVETLTRIEVNPQSFPVLETIGEATHIRRARVFGFPYVLIFELLDQDVYVFAIAHTSRRPKYWRRREKP